MTQPTGTTGNKAENESARQANGTTPKDGTHSPRTNNGDYEALNTSFDAEEMLQEYLEKAGCIPSETMDGSDKEDRMRQTRQRNFHNVISFLINQRKLRITYQVFLDEFGERTITEAGMDYQKEKESPYLFDTLSRRMELLSVVEDRRFNNIYSPQIMAGRRFEIALNSLDFALKILRAQDADAYDLIKMVYIDGPKAPPIRDVITKMGISGTSTYYAQLERAHKKLSEALFGWSDNKRELQSVLVFFQQQNDEPTYPEF